MKTETDMGWERKVPNEAKLVALMKAGKQHQRYREDLSQAYAGSAVYVIRYGLIECRTNAVRLAEPQNRPAPSSAKRGFAVHDDRITFTRDAHVAGRGWNCANYSAGAEDYVAAVAAKQGGAHASL